MFRCKQVCVDTFWGPDVNLITAERLKHCDTKIDPEETHKA